MRFMMIVKATKESEAGAMPGEKTADMAKYNEKTEVVTDGRLHGRVEGCVIGRVESPKIIASLARTVRELLLTRAPRRIRSS